MTFSILKAGGTLMQMNLLISLFFFFTPIQDVGFIDGFDTLTRGGIHAGGILLGDINGDGVVNLLDVGPFIDLLSNGKFNPAADFNGDGAVNLLDVEGFIDVLSGS